MMRREEAESRLHDYLDGVLSRQQELEFEEYVLEHPELRDEVEAMRLVIQRAGEMPENVLPERDLWPDILQRIEGKVTPLPVTRKRRISGILPYVVAAAAVLVIVAGLGLWSRPPIQSPPPSNVALTEVERAEQEYRQAKAALLAALEERRDQIAPETLLTVEENLAVIEAAVQDIRMAMADDEASPQLERMLIATYQNEVNLLRQAVQLANAG